MKCKICKKALEQHKYIKVGMRKEFKVHHGKCKDEYDRKQKQKHARRKNKKTTSVYAILSGTMSKK